ncbi:MauE/DoxX family redox-associated membrane protein [Micromonospora sp. NPDC047557]|uniref:MauE/DoxX family redox-associated membrane protein n=1 Tax=Micromonospora sp. NPDC047557 TaxID=3364250 RepID=UPI00371CFEDF
MTGERGPAAPPPDDRESDVSEIEPYLTMTLRCLIGATFLLAALGKLIGRTALRDFTASLRAMQVLPSGSIRPAALLVIAAETGTCLLLAVPARPAQQAGFVLAGVLLAAFSTVIAATLRRGRRMRCHCFGAARQPLGVAHLARNTGLLLACGIGLAGVSAAAAGEMVGLVTAAFAGLVMAVLISALDDILVLFRPLPAGTPPSASRQR